MDYDKLIEAFTKCDHFGAYNKIRVLELKKGYSRAQMPIGEHNLNCMGTVHGGALFTLADIVGGTCMLTHGRRCSTLDSNISFLRPVKKGPITAIGQEVRLGGRIGVAEIKIYDGEGELVCQGSCTMYLTKEKIDWLGSR